MNTGKVYFTTNTVCFPRCFHQKVSGSDVHLLAERDQHGGRGLQMRQMSSEGGVAGRRVGKQAVSQKVIRQSPGRLDRICCSPDLTLALGLCARGRPLSLLMLLLLLASL